MPFTTEQKRQYYRDNPDKHALIKQSAREHYNSKYRGDAEFRAKERARILERYYVMKKKAMEQPGNTLEDSGLPICVGGT